MQNYDFVCIVGSKINSELPQHRLVRGRKGGEAALDVNATHFNGKIKGNDYVTR